jgi:tetratricopeptide (TPR) repeat protein
LAYWVLFSVTSSVIPARYLATDYRQYPSLAFVCLGLAIALFTLPRYRFGVGAAVALAVYFSAATFHLNTDWRTEESFWAQSVRHGGTALSHSNYAMSVAAKDPALAQHHYLEAIRIYPNHVYANINLALLYIRQGRGDEGLALLRGTVARNPGWAQTRYWLASGLRSLGRTREALVEFRRAADLDPRSLRYQYAAARALQSAGNVAASIPYLERVVPINPRYRNGLFLLGFAHQSTGRRGVAIKEYSLFLRERPKHVQARFNLAYALMKAGDCGAAIEHFERALTLRRSYAEIHRHLALCYRSLGDEVKAGKHAALYRRNRGK